MTAQLSRRGLDLVVREELAEAALWRGHLNQPSNRTRQMLFNRYVKFAKRVAYEQFRRRPSDNFDLADVEQLAIEALLQSIDRYEPLRNIPFQSFARSRIKGNISNWLNKSSESNAYFSYKYRAEKERLSSLMAVKDNDKSPIAALSKLAATLAIGLMLEEQGKAADSLASTEPSAYDTLVWQEMDSDLRDKVDNLPEKEAFVVRQHYRNGVSFQQISLLLGLSKGRISQLHAAALARLRLQLSKYK